MYFNLFLRPARGEVKMQMYELQRKVGHDLGFKSTIFIGLDFLRDKEMIDKLKADHQNYGDYIFNADSSDINDKAIFSYGVKSTNQLYHFDYMIGYKVINLKDNMTKETFITIENINENFKNVTDRGDDYE